MLNLIPQEFIQSDFLSLFADGRYGNSFRLQDRPSTLLAMLYSGNGDNNRLDHSVIQMLFISCIKPSDWHDWIFHIIYSSKLLICSDLGVISHFTVQHLSAVCCSEFNFKVTVVFISKFRMLNPIILTFFDDLEIDF